jgi:hypothetical protein
MNVKGSDLRLPAARGLDPAGPNSVFFNGIGQTRTWLLSPSPDNPGRPAGSSNGTYDTGLH